MFFICNVVDVAGVEPALVYLQLIHFLTFHALMRGTSLGPVLTSIMLYPSF